MFGSKRRRAASNPPLNGSNANPSAASAAAQAFLKNRASNVSLASAAAGAALRSRPMTPTSVAEVQTKRMLRRAGSTSSAGSDRSAGSNSRPQLQRRGSGSSMSERTFREPSPNRSSPVPSAVDAPPVPAIPKNLSQRRSASVEAMRIASPPPNRSTGRGSSLEPTGSAPPRKLGHRSTASNAELTTRPESRGSVNYSYPMNARPRSPLDNELTDDAPSRRPVITAPNNQNLIYDPNTRSFLPAAEIHAIEQRLRDVVNAPVKKQKRIAPKQATGTHLANGTVGGRIKGTAVDAMELAAKQPPKEPPKPKQTAIQQPPVERPKVPSELEAAPAPEPVQKSIPEPTPEPSPEPVPTTAVPPRKKKKKVTISESGSEGGSIFGSESESDVSSRAAYSHRPAVPLTKKPSIVREDREREEEEDDTPTKRASYQNTHLNYGGLGGASQDNRTESPTPLPRSAAGRGHSRGQSLSSAAFAEEREETRPAGQTTPEPITQGMNGNGLAANGTARVSSVSPTRTAHFSMTPDNLAVKHQPPGRSASPRKSALKHSPSTRDDSPSGLPGSFQGGSEVSDNSVASEDHLKPKKKSVRVSFDDENTVVLGHAAPSVETDSPVVQSPQVAKRGWFSMGRGKKKDMQSIEDEGDEVMKPRPALPSFGSVRGRKDRDTTVAPERSLVKPPEPIFNAAKSPSPRLVESSTESNDFPLGQSNDHIIGAVLSQEQTARNAANISKSREPLPPEVTSVEGSGYVSDDSSSTHSVEEQQPADRASPNNHEDGPEVNKVPEAQKEEIRDLAAESPKQATTRANGTNGHVPTIAVLPATPKAEDPVPDQDWFSMPGGWEVSDTGSQQPSPQIVAQHHATNPTPADIGRAEPTPAIQHPGTPAVGEIAAAQYHPGAILEESEESDDDSIYSDAAEELSDLEGNGFMSLDAVVESPVASIPKSVLDIPPKTISPPESPTIKSVKESAYKRSGLAPTDSQEPDLDEGWNKAQLYWSGLTAEKKRLLEQEAREEAEADTSEQEEKPSPKPKKTKTKVTVKAQVEAPQQHQPAFRSDRTYMIAPGSKMDPDGHTPIAAPKPTHSMKSSMRAEPANTASEPHMRKSMRNATSSPSMSSGSMRSSMREGPPQTKGSLQKKYRPMSMPTSEIMSDPVAVNNHIRALSASSAALAQRRAAEKPVGPTLRRRGSDDSDSSFKRARPKSEGSKFRGSMRGSAQRHESPMGSSRFSLRSLSPTGSTMRRPFSQQNNVAPPVTMRPSLRENNRNSYDSGKTPSLRLGRTKSPSSSGLMGFGRSKPPAPPILPRSRGSRFADSDSEDEKPRPAFRSRFADSDSDDDGPVPSQVRGGFSRGTMRSSAPTRTAPTPSTLKPPFRKELEDGDSSDLPDSDDEKPPLTQQNKSPILTNGNLNGHRTSASLGTGTMRRSGSGRGTISSSRVTDSTATTPSRPNAGRRGSFLNILKRKKADPSTKVRKSDAESPARRDTPLERSKSDRAAIKTPRPMSPKLQKRNPVSRENSTSWPLPASSAITRDDDDRPFTSDGLDSLDDKITNSDGRPSLGTRRFTATGLSAVDVAFPDTPRKKKKFQALRKMFRLDD